MDDGNPFPAKALGQKIARDPALDVIAATETKDDRSCGLVEKCEIIRTPASA
jgi:hypothetical protein